jgi:hypothetical protein
MGINQLRLSAELIAALYPESLVLPDNGDPARIPGDLNTQIPPNNTDYPYLGKNRRSICFLVSYPDDEFIPPGQLAFLQKILSACKCSLDDIALINTSRTPVVMEALKNQLNPEIVFLWGNPPDVIGMQQNFPDMIISTWENLTILPVLKANLMSRDIPESVEPKRNLWISLKKLFSL